jgi:hypothetical protein
MSQQFIVTTPQNSGLGTPLATAFNYTNSNFSELYSRFQTTPPVSLVGQSGDVAGMYASDNTYFYYCFANYDGSSVIWAQVTQVGNISVSSIQSGNSNVQIVGASANVAVGINNVANVAVFATTGIYATGVVSATGNVRGAYILGDGSQLTNLPVPYDDANVIVLLSAYGNNTISTTGNINSGNLISAGSVSATGNISANYFLGNGSQLTGLPATYSNANVVSLLSSFGNNVISTTGTVTAGNVTGGNILTSGQISATGNILTQTVVSAVGNIITDGYFVGTFFGNVTGNFVVPGSNTQVIFNTSGNADAVGGFTYNKDSNTMSVLGIVSAQGNVIAGNVTTVGQVSATGNITGDNLLASNITGTLITASQPNVTDLGTLTSLNVTGAVSSAGNVTASGNITATGSVTAGNVVCNGDISAITTSGGTITGLSLSVSGNVTAASLIGTIATASQTGITAVGTLTSLSVSGNVQGGNLRTAGQLSVTGNITGGNITLTNVNAGGNVSATNHTGTAVSVTGNVTGGNLRTGGQVSATGNITGNYFFGNIASATGMNTYGNADVVSLLSSFGSNNISTTGNVTASSVAGGIITGTSASVTGNVTAASLIGAVATASQTAITAVGTLSSLSVSGNTTAGNIFTAGAVSATGNVTGASLIGNIVTASQTAITEVGTLTSLSVAGNTVSGNLSVSTGTITLGNIINANGNAVGNIGTASNYFNTVFALATSALYADLAENYIADAEYAPGTVVIFGGDQQITVTTERADERVAGVVSTNPAYLMNSGESGAPIALRGKVPVRVVGPVYKGDSLITSSTPGVAESVGRSRDYAQAVFAKSLETCDSQAERVILAVIV